MSQRLFAGAAKRSITPDETLRRKLPCIRDDRRFEEVVGDGLFVRTIAFRSGTDTALFIQYELDQAPFAYRSMAAITEKYGIPMENIFMLGDHSHEIPLTGNRLAEPEHNEYRSRPEFIGSAEEYESFIFNAMMETVEEAVSSLQPVRVGYAEGDSRINEFRHMRFPSIYPLDTTLSVMKLEREDGSTLALLLNYSSHNNAVNLDYTLCSDLEGCLTSLLERRFPDAVAMWTLSAHGDIMARQDYWNVPVMANPPEFADPSAVAEPYLKRMRILALRQYQDTLDILERIVCRDIFDAEILGAVEYADVPFKAPYEREDGSIVHMGGTAVITAEQRAKQKGFLRNAALRALRPEPAEWKLRLHCVRIGELVFIGNGGKLYNSYKPMLRNMLPVKFTSLVLSQDTCETSTVTYVYDDRAILEMAAEGRPIGIKPGDTAAAMRACMERMLQKIGIEPV